MSKKDNKEEIDSKASSTKASWTSEDEAVLVHTLLNEKSKGNWGDNNPKKQAWSACEAALAGSEKATKSCCKDVSSIKSCWQRVSAPRAVESLYTHAYMQLKQSYDRVKGIRDQSGWGWNHKKNLPRVEDDVWDKYIKVSKISLCDVIVMHICSQSHPKSRPWHTKPFPLYDEMADLVDGLRASGKMKYKPANRREEETPGASSIPIDPVLLVESTRQERLYLDTDSDNDVCSMSLALSHYLYISSAILPRAHMMIMPTQTPNPKRGTRVL